MLRGLSYLLLAVSLTSFLASCGGQDQGGPTRYLTPFSPNSGAGLGGNSTASNEDPMAAAQAIARSAKVSLALPSSVATECNANSDINWAFDASPSGLKLENPRTCSPTLSSDGLFDGSAKIIAEMTRPSGRKLKYTLSVSRDLCPQTTEAGRVIQEKGANADGSVICRESFTISSLCIDHFFEMTFDFQTADSTKPNFNILFVSSSPNHDLMANCDKSTDKGQGLFASQLKFLTPSSSMIARGTMKITGRDRNSGATKNFCWKPGEPLKLYVSKAEGGVRDNVAYQNSRYRMGAYSIDDHTTSAGSYTIQISDFGFYAGETSCPADATDSVMKSGS